MVMKICRNCQEEFTDKVPKCLYCGGALEIVATPGQRTLDEPDKKEQIGIDPGKIWKYYKIPITTIIIIIFVAGILFTISQRPDVNKDAEQVTGTEHMRVEAPVAPAPESAPEPKLAPAPEPALVPKPPPASTSAIDMYNNGVALCSGGKCTDPQKAIEYLTEAIRLQPDFANAYGARGNAYGDLRQYQPALEDYDKAISLKPDRTGFFNNRGNVYKDLNKYQLAVEDYNEAIRLKPDDAKAYHNRGNAYFIQGNKEIGCLDAQKACELGVCKLLEFAKEKGFCH
jgi:hypothetical protein